MRFVFALLFCSSLIAGDADWPVYGHDAAGTKYSPLKSINRENVAKLKVAWVYHSHDQYVPGEGQGGKRSAFETTPLVIDGVMYLTTAFGRIIALNPATGEEKWAFDPHVDMTSGFGDPANRGVAAWVNPATKQRRLFIGTLDARLIAVDAESGKLCEGFGNNGQVDLKVGLRIGPHGAWEYEETSPPAVINGTVVVGSGIADNTRADAASGEVRAFDALTGKLKWTWDPMPGTKTGAANAWSIISIDAARNLVFVPTGSASPDYYGGERVGDNLHANSIVALHADTGKVAWHFQTVHHDLWDYDVASQPVLLTINKGGKKIDAVAVGSKTGNLFVLDRATGKPIFGVDERPVPKSDIEGEAASPTQPFPRLPKPLATQTKLTVDDAWGPTEEVRKACAEQIGKLRSDGIFTPPSLQGSLVTPGNIGGMHWGGMAFDPATGNLIVPTNLLPAVVRLIKRADFDAEEKNGAPGWEFARQRGTPYGMVRKLLMNNGVPCTKPPFGLLTAVNMATGEIAWQSPLPRPALGGPIVTGGGLVFLGATVDARFRAFDTSTGKQLWEAELPAGARATPMTYEAGGRQFVVIAAGGFDVPGLQVGDSLVAFALER